MTTHKTSLWKDGGVFLLLSLFLMIIIGVFLLTFSKADIHLWMNSCHTPTMDFFFRYYTYVGEWVPYVVVFGLLFYKAGWASYLLGSVAVSGLISQRLKYVFDTDRPLTYFHHHFPDIQLQLVEGVHMSKFYSFPSGHTTSFFALFLVLCVLLNSHLMQTATRYRQWLVGCIVPLTCFVWAVLGAYSRIYLSQHFLEDILGGMLLGILCTSLLFPLVSKWENTTFWNWNFRCLLTSKQRLSR